MRSPGPAVTGTSSDRWLAPPTGVSLRPSSPGPGRPVTATASAGATLRAPSPGARALSPAPSPGARSLSPGQPLAHTRGRSEPSIRSERAGELALNPDVWESSSSRQAIAPEEVRDIFKSTEDVELAAPLIRHRASSHSQGNGAVQSEDSPVHEEERVEFGYTGYTLVLLSGRLDFLLIMLGIASGQFGVLWLVAYSSPEYFFESGQWNEPISRYWSVNWMKSFSLLLTLFRVTGEFKDATNIYRVLYHKLKTPMAYKNRVLGSCAFMLQYLVATLVLFMAIHLILASTTPIATIGKLWVVYIVLDFDNHWCNFMLYILHLQEAYNWTVVLDKTRSSHASQESLWGYFAPVCIGLAIVCYSLAFNVCPLTRLHYGVVRNDGQVLMLSPTLGLPEGCCPPQIEWNAGKVGGQATANVSVPCLSPYQEPPLMYYVVVPDGRPSPSSLQVMEGRGGDGNVGLHHGSVQTKSLQMHWWLSKHGFSHNNIYHDMASRGSGGLGMYSSNFPFFAAWEIKNIWREQRVRIFAAAKNPVTGALSPVPVQSAVILRKGCDQGCIECSSDSGACWKCERGYVKVAGTCQPCASGCSNCDSAGAGHCDRNGCGVGHGLAVSGTACKPCAGGAHCATCDAASGADVADGNAQALPCRTCKAGHGLESDGSCKPCEVAFCSNCPDLKTCKDCLPGRVLQLQTTTDDQNVSTTMQTCLACAEHCSQCKKLGAGKCDPERCEAGYSLSPTGVCKACSSHCTNCTKSGPGNCDNGHCKLTYGLQGYSNCIRCTAEHCHVCDRSPSTCDACAEGFALTVEGTCEACADSCKRCTEVGDHCAECNPRFGLDDGKCFACADHCLRCQDTGPGQCDVGHCESEWISSTTVDGSSICVPDTAAEVHE